ncbi:uncharacterized protein C4orf45 homolog [Python bivittatus]|uniref:Uncharacterized protein C4orf45 homolog n=1 Tax=Python bivittatus TaxID=176946 RepID=A0A9F5J6Z7_PYTBI|nr:uncharacterized protein C4orf45 homolog [Python bivittatus]
MAKRCTLSSAPPVFDSGKRTVYTGPDGTGNYQPKVLDYCHYIGATSSPVEGTSDAKYLWRPAPSNPPPWIHRHCFVGEIGWRTKEFGSHNQIGLSQGKKIMPKLFPPAEEFEIINQYKNPSNKILAGLQQVRKNFAMDTFLDAIKQECQNLRGLNVAMKVLARTKQQIKRKNKEMAEY